MVPACRANEDRCRPAVPRGRWPSRHWMVRRPIRTHNEHGIEMRRLMRNSLSGVAMLCAAGIMVTACNDTPPWLPSVPTQPSVITPVPPPPAPPRRDPAVEEIRLGQVIDEDIDYADLTCT